MKKLFLLALAAGVLLVFALRGGDKQEIVNSSPMGEHIICFGDSLTAGVGASPGMDYPSQLSRLIGRPVINAGLSGDTTSGGLRRLEQEVLSRSPRIVLITLGGNDLKNGTDRDTVFQNLELIIELIQEKGALVILGGIDVPLFGRGFGSAYRQVAEKTGAVLVPNVFEGVMGNPGLMHDRIHPNDEGYRKMALHFQRALSPYLE